MSSSQSFQPGTCKTCEGDGYAPTRFGRQICHACRGTGVVRVETPAAGPVETGPTAAQMEQMIIEIDQLLDRYREGRQEEEIAAVEQRCRDFIEKTRMAIDAGMSELYAPLMTAFEKIQGMEQR